MLMHEDFTRCDCGCALIKKEEYITAMYSKAIRWSVDAFILKSKVIEYTCKDCKKIIHTETTTEV